MKLYTTLLLLFATQLYYAQNNTEIFLFDLSEEDAKVTISNGKNISNSKGYDSQPYFLDNRTLLYAGTRDGNTEIIQYENGKERILNKATAGGEYSPQPLPKGKGISAVRLDPNGYQRLYMYKTPSSKAEELIKDAVVAYYTWYDTTTIVGADIVDNELHLVIHDLKNVTKKDLGLSVGRSFHTIPNTDLISFIDKTNDIWVVKSINPRTQEIQNITPLLSGIEDIAWLKDGRLIASKGNTLYIKRKEEEWKTLKTFDETMFTKMSRIALSPDGSRIAIVAELPNE